MRRLRGKPCNRGVPRHELYRISSYHLVSVKVTRLSHGDNYVIGRSSHIYCAHPGSDWLIKTSPILWRGVTYLKRVQVCVVVCGA